MAIARADLASAVHEALEGRVETLFGDTVDTLDDDGDRVHVRFRNENPRDFDLVGADGLHSRVRSLTFGPQQQFETTSESSPPPSTSRAIGRATSSSP